MTKQLLASVAAIVLLTGVIVLVLFRWSRGPVPGDGYEIPSTPTTSATLPPTMAPVAQP